MTNGNLETRVTALEAQMQEMRELLQQTVQLQTQMQEQLKTTLDIANSNARSIQAWESLAQETLAIANSNARSIQAWESRIEENRDEAEEERSELRVGLNNLRDSVAELVRLARRNEVEHELFRRRFEAIDPLTDGE